MKRRLGLLLSALLVHSGTLSEIQSDQTGPTLFFRPESEETGTMWDTWCIHHEGKFYLYYLGQRPDLQKAAGYDGAATLQNISMSVSEDGHRWEEKGVLWTKHDGATWIGAGQVYPSPDFAKDGLFYMNYSQHFGPFPVRDDADAAAAKQRIYFATSNDLVNWDLLGLESESAPSEEAGYRIDGRGRWDAINPVPKEEGKGYHGYLSGTPLGAPGFGYATSEDGLNWTPRPPVLIEGDRARGHEVGFCERIGDRYYLCHRHGNEMFLYVAEKAEGPFRPQAKNFLFLRRPALFPRSFRGPDGEVLVNYQHVGRGGPTLPPFKEGRVDDEGVFRLHWWKGNESLKAVPASVENETPDPRGIIPFDLGLDPMAGRIIEGTIALPAQSSVERNFALDAKLSASSQAGPSAPGGVVDEDEATFWRSDDFWFANKDREAGEEWFQIELPESTKIGRVEVGFHTLGWASRFELQTSEDGATWKTEREVAEKERSFSLENLGLEARFLRLRLLESGSQHGYMITKLALYEKAQRPLDLPGVMLGCAGAEDSAILFDAGGRCVFGRFVRETGRFVEDFAVDHESGLRSEVSFRLTLEGQEGDLYLGDEFISGFTLVRSPNGKGTWLPDSDGKVAREIEAWATVAESVETAPVAAALDEAELLWENGESRVLDVDRFDFAAPELTVTARFKPTAEDVRESSLVSWHLGGWEAGFNLAISPINGQTVLGVMTDFGKERREAVTFPQMFLGAPVDLRPGEWHEVVFTRKEKGALTELFLDGKLIAYRRSGSVYPRSAHWFPRNPKPTLRIGSDPGDRYPFRGEIERVAAWSSCLSDEIIGELFQGDLDVSHRDKEWTVPQMRGDAFFDPALTWKEIERETSRRIVEALPGLVADDPHFPRYHLAAPADSYNLIVRRFGGRWHFFAAHGQGWWQTLQKPGPIPYIHFSSEDLVKWVLHGLADWPASRNGSVTDHEGTAYAFSGWNTPGGRPPQLVISRSRDPLLEQWEYDQTTPVPIESPEGDQLDDCDVFFRDGAWNLLAAVSGAKKPESHAYHHYRSIDLETWEYTGPFYDLGVDDPHGAELPHFFFINDTAYLANLYHHFDPADPEPRDYQTYHFGDWKDDRFIKQGGAVVDHGVANSGAKEFLWTTRDENGRTLMWEWNRGHGMGLTTVGIKERFKAGWNTIYSLPREVVQRADRTLGVRPAKELEELRGEGGNLARRKVAPDEPVALPSVGEGSFEVRLKMRTNHVAGLRIHDGDRHAAIIWEPGNGEVNLELPGVGDMSREQKEKSALFFTAPLELSGNEPIELRVFVDRSIIEVFALDGRAISARWFPSDPTALRAEVFAAGESAVVESVEWWPMGSIWPEVESRPMPTTDVAYGPDERQTLDLHLAEGEGARPLVLYFHGGGWLGGDKSRHPSFAPFLENGISCATVGYRLTGKDPLPAPVHDAARAVQFLRANAARWNLDPERIGVMGNSAGGCSALWIALHDDLADPQSADPVSRFSTRVSAAAAVSAQTTIEPLLAADWIDDVVLDNAMFGWAVGEKDKSRIRDVAESEGKRFEEFSPVRHLDRDDPPVFLAYPDEATLPPRDAAHAIHHPRFGIRFKEAADSVEHSTTLKTGPEDARDPNGQAAAFLIRELLSEKAPPDSNPENQARTPNSSPLPKLLHDPETGLVADTIPFFWRGEWHVYFLHPVAGGRCDWEHVSTRDFSEWTVHPTAIRGGDDPAAIDRSAFTGSVVRDEARDRFLIFYTGHNIERRRNKQTFQTILAAESRDLVHWNKLPDFRLPPSAEAGYRDPGGWRDPFVFSIPGSDEFGMLITAVSNQAGGECLGFARSENLLDWTVEEPFTINHGETNSECPDLFRMGDWWYLISFDRAEGHQEDGNGSLWQTRYRRSRSWNGPWESDPSFVFDGQAFGAAKTAGDERQRYLFGWLARRKPARDGAELGWGGSLLGYELVQDAEGRLGTRLPRTWLSTLRGGMTRIDSATESPVFLRANETRLVEISCLVKPGQVKTINLQSEGGGDAVCHLQIDRKTNRLELLVAGEASGRVRRIWRPLTEDLPDTFLVRVVREESALCVEIDERITLSGRFYSGTHAP